ncbi:E3 ubiquitin-protein ligase [Maudiozyma humilis]|uniref:HECT-type E3 ubiquitin transferase n=1 Tax=Maudiozyma humilis TaxID=51915 RepID=A0AAV5S0P8_MAUHU|nr:E3 ubiquitin-protein ligase [Kazachstania humilis]
MLQLSRLEIYQKDEIVEKFKPLIDELTTCNDESFLTKLIDIQEWDRARDDLYVWIPVLNRIDEMLSRVIDKYGYRTNDFQMKPVKLVCMNKSDIDMCTILMEFSCRLLYNTENRYIYSSMDVMNNLLNCPNFEIKLGAIKILAIMGERYQVSRERIDSNNVLSDHNLKKKALQLALVLPSSVSDDSGSHVTLVDLFTSDKSYPDKWSKFKYTYHIAEKKKNEKDESAVSSSESTFMKKFTINNNELVNSSLQELFDKGMHALPNEFWYDFSLRVTVAKAFSDNSPSSNQLLNLIIRTKFNTVAYINTVYPAPQVSSKLFEVDPYTFNSLSEFISLAEPKIPSKLRLDCLFALECISLRHVWCSDIMRNLGGNLAHGALFLILRQIGKLLRSKNEEISEEYNVRFFYLVSNVADVKSLHSSLLSAGFIPCLLDIVSVSQTKYKRTITSATHLLEVFINDADSTSEFITNDGFNILINAVRNEVDFVLENPNSGKPSPYASESYSVSFRQQAYIRSLLKLVVKLLKTDSGDRIRNLIDSPLLKSMSQILNNPTIFGNILVVFTLDIIQKVINSEPTIYQVLVDAGLIPYIFDNFSQLLVPSSEMIYLLPDLISALCLNVEGLNQVKEKNIIGQLFNVMTEVKFARAISWKDEASEFGTFIDELARHYPNLKDPILDSFCDFIKRIPSSVTFSQPFIYTSHVNGHSFYYSKDENVVENEENSTELCFWDTQQSSVVIDCFSNLLYGMSLENVVLQKFSQRLDVKHLIAILDTARPPFDFSSSQAMLNITDALQLIDEHDKDYAFLPLLKLLERRLGELDAFLNHDDTSSFFLSKAKNDNKKDLQYLDNVTAELSRITSLMYVVTSVYLSFSSLSPTRLLQITDYFNEQGFDLITYIGLLFRRCALEEMYIRQSLPPTVVDETTPDSLFNLPPIKIYAVDKIKGGIKDNKTSAKFKNTLEVRSIVCKLQTFSALLYRCFLRLTHTRTTGIELNDKSIEIQIFDKTVQQLVNMLGIGLNDNNVSFYLVLLHFITYVMTYSRTTMTTNDILQTLPALIFYQKGGYSAYTSLILELFPKMMNIKTSNSIDDTFVVKDSPLILTVSCMVNALSFINRSTRIGGMETIKNAESYFPSMKGKYDVVGTFSSYVKKSALCMIYELCEHQRILQLTSRSIPYPVYKAILTVITNIYMESPSDDATDLMELDWKVIPPSQKKVEILMKAGISEDVAKAYLEEKNDRLPTERDTSTFSDDEWQRYEKLLKHSDNLTDAVSMVPVVKPESSLNALRIDFFKKQFSSSFFNVLPYYPKLINSFTQTLLQMLKCIEEPIRDISENIFQSIKATPMENTSKLSSLIHILGILLNEEEVYLHSEEMLSDFMSYLTDILRPEHVNTIWFSKALYAYEVLFARSDIPHEEKLSENIKMRFRLPPLPSFYHISENVQQVIFDNIIRVGDITNFYSAVSITRILLIYCKDEKKIEDIIHSRMLPKILKVIGAYQLYEKINFLEASYLLLLRRCFETPRIISDLIEHEVKDSFVSKTLGNHTERSRELTSLLEDKAHIVARNPREFIKQLSSSCKFIEFDRDGTLWNFTLERNGDDDVGSEVASTDSSDFRSKRTGIVHLIISQLMAASKKDWLSEPPNSSDNNNEGKTSSNKPDPSRNPVCAYMIFLLKILVELITSYKQCKYEFLTYDRRHVYMEEPKPRSTALNFFLYQLLDETSSQEHNRDEMKRREVISMLSRSVIVGFTSSIIDKSTTKRDLKQIDPDMAYVRKFTIDIIIRALKNVSVSEQALETNVNKIDSWFNVLSLMVYVQAPYLRLLLDTNNIDADRYQICRMMIDQDIPAAITDCMAIVDINLPFSKKLFNSGVEVLNAINTTRNDFESLFKIEGIDEDEVDDVESDKDEVSNMFKNSSLGMYDVDDIEEDDDADIDEDSLIGDDEDIAFVDDDPAAYDIVCSDDNAIEDENEASDASEESNMTYATDTDGIEVEMIDSNDDEDSSHSSDDDSSIDSYYGVEDGSVEDYSGSEGANESEIDVVSVNEDESSFDSSENNSDLIDIDLSDYSIDDTDWESGLSALSASNSDMSSSDEDAIPNSTTQYDSARRVWTFGDGTVLEDEPSDSETRGIFQGIQHTFNPDAQELFRIDDNTPDHHHHHQRFSRSHLHPSRLPPSLTLLRGNRRNQSNLLNPLSPTGLEQTENTISEQLSSIRSGIRPRPHRTHFSDVLLSGELFDEHSIEGIVLKSSLLRWKDCFDMFHNSKRYGHYVIAASMNAMYAKSFEMYKKKVERALEELKGTEAISDEQSSQDDYSDEGYSSDSDISIDSMPVHTGGVSGHHTDADGNIIEHEPVYVTIDGQNVDIGGTDIDPEFLRALPEEMRSEVFAEHIRERRAASFSQHEHVREIDPDFLNALPSNIREDITAGDNLTNTAPIIGGLPLQHESSVFPSARPNENGDTHSSDDVHREAILNTQESDPHVSSEPTKKKPEKIYFENLLDRPGVAALMKSIFISQPYIKREIYHELFYRLCASKQNRSDIVNILLLILTEGTLDQHSLERMYNTINNRADRSGKSQTNTTRSLPPDCTPLIVANQTIEILQSLIDTDKRLKFFFITEHDNLMINRSFTKARKDTTLKPERWPVKYLFDLFGRKMITDETVLMDLLTNILQVCTKPIPALVRNSRQPTTKKIFQIPEFNKEDLGKIVSIIDQDSCNTKIFQQTLSVMYHLSYANNSLSVFTDELTNRSVEIVKRLSDDLLSLASNTSKNAKDDEMDNDLVQRMTVPSSDQAKLLKILTALDYLYSHKKREDNLGLDKLAQVYNNMNLGRLWGSLSDCLSEFEKRKDLNTSATILLPSIESLMVVCKHSNINKENTRSLTYEEEKTMDFSSIQVENLFFPFTDIHKKMLNQMIRSNPKLMSGPFALLVKNPRILDFDNKRYYFVAKLKIDSTEIPKLPISVRRDQVFLDSYRSLFFKSSDEIKNSKLEITFNGESGVDAGGLTREWYQVLSRQMFNPDYALFLPIPSDKTTFHPNRSSGVNPEHLSFFKFTGMIIGKAIRDQCYLDCHFSREVYKSILGKPVSLKDMDSVDPDYYKSLVWILKNDITDIIEETFSIDVDDYGEHKTVDLIENGRNIAVTNENKHEYVKKIIEFKLCKSVQAQLDNLIQGFYSLIPKELISIFNEQELELLISGLPDIDVDDWKNNTKYVNYTANSREIGYFWRAVRSFDTEERAKLIQFVTGTSKVPLNGFKELSGVGGVCQFSIHRDYGSADRLPSSHTCFNQLNLPAYASYEALRGSLLLAINEGSEGFGLA